MTAYASPHVKLMTSYDGIRGQSVKSTNVDETHKIFKIPRKGPSIKYVTLFLANVDPPVTLCHTSRDPPKVRHTSRTPQIFSRPSTKNPDKSPLYKFYLNCSQRFLSGGFCRGW